MKRKNLFSRACSAVRFDVQCTICTCRSSQHRKDKMYIYQYMYMYACLACHLHKNNSFHEWFKRLLFNSPTHSNNQCQPWTSVPLTHHNKWVASIGPYSSPSSNVSPWWVGYPWSQFTMGNSWVFKQQGYSNTIQGQWKSKKTRFFREGGPWFLGLKMFKIQGASPIDRLGTHTVRKTVGWLEIWTELFIGGSGTFFCRKWSTNLAERNGHANWGKQKVLRGG